MLTIEELNSLNVGDQVQTVGLFDVVTKEPVVLRVLQATAFEPKMVEFDVTYFGIKLGIWTATATAAGQINWGLGA